MQFLNLGLFRLSIKSKTYCRVLACHDRGASIINLEAFQFCEQYDNNDVPQPRGSALSECFQFIHMLIIMPISVLKSIGLFVIL